MSNKVIPYNKEAEETLLGNMILFPESLKEVVESGLVSEDFYFEKHQRLFSIIYNMYDLKQKVDHISLADKLKDYDYYDKVGGLDYLMHLTDLTVNAANTNSYIRIIKNKSISRQIIKAGEEIATEGYEGNKTIDELLEIAENRIRNINNNMADNGFRGVEIFDETFKKIKYLQEQGSSITGVRSLYSDLDKITAGFQKGDLIILAARPGMGKTAFALNVAMNAASVTPGSVAIFSLEMPYEQLALRMYAAKAEVPINKLRTGKPSDSDWARLLEAKQLLMSQKFLIDDTPAAKVSDMFNRCRKLKNDNNSLSLVIIDYIQLIQATSKSESRQQEVSEISRRLKAMARELNVPVIALSQLSRNVEQRQDKRPMLSDLRESGALEQDADLVLFLYRDDYYDKKKDELGGRTDIELHIAKHRNGATGKVTLAFEKDINAFYSVKNNNGEQA